MCCDGKQSKTDGMKQRAEEQQRQRGDGLQSNDYSVSIYCVSVGSSGTLEHSRALRLQGRRPLVPMCRSIGEVGDWGGGQDFTGDLLRRKKGCQDVATVDGPESTIKSARDQKRWKLAAV
ncbi:hypothetical protein GW17_00038267 [Ensete ventricosum]|nr:hypothetical protein GW17_00038267 [Ensete ventricosum]